MIYLGLLIAFVGFGVPYGDGIACEDMLVVLPNDNTLLRYFDHFDAIGRYRRVGDQLHWTQLNGRHHISIGRTSNSSYAQNLSFSAFSPTSNSSSSIGLSAEFLYSFDPSDDNDYTYRLHDQLFSWTIYNHTFKQFVTTYTFEFDELFIYCMDEKLNKSVSVCTGDRILDVELYISQPDGTKTILNDPKTDVLRPIPGVYSEGRRHYLQGRAIFSILYLDLPLTNSRAHSWFVYYHTNGTAQPIYFGSNYNEAAPIPELTFDPWIRAGNEEVQLNNLVKCAAKLPNCSRCDSSNTDACLEGYSSSLFYCVCKQGYQGETCDQLSPTCPQPPSELFGWVPNYYQGGPFYSGEIITVSCNADYPSLLSRWKYTSTCTDNGTWTSTETCLDWSLVSKSVNRSDDAEVVSALIEEVTKRVADMASSTPSPFTIYVSQEWLIAVAMAIWVILPVCTMLVGWLCLKNRRQSNELLKQSLWRMLSAQTYIWVWIYILWGVFSISFEFSKETTDVFSYIDITTLILAIILYIFHIVATFLSSEMATLSKRYPILTTEYFDSMKQHNRPELFVTAEVYHDEEITRNIHKANDDGVVCSETVTMTEPVITKCYRAVFNYDACRDITEDIQLTPHAIVQVRLQLEVFFQDETTKNEFSAMKSRLDTITQGDQASVNTYQIVCLPTKDHQLRGGLDVIVNGIAKSRKFYTNVWFFRVLVFFLLALPMQIFLRRRVMRPGVNHVVRKVVSGVKEQPTRLSVLGDSERPI